MHFLFILCNIQVTYGAVTTPTSYRGGPGSNSRPVFVVPLILLGKIPTQYLGSGHDSVLAYQLQSIIPKPYRPTV